MKPDLEEQLFKKHPKIFSQKDLPMDQTCMCWGIDTGDGWFNLIDELCSKLELICGLACVDVPQAVQVKEKWGQLRFYHNGVTTDMPEIDNLIDFIVDAYEELSGHICDVCGDWGNIDTTQSWYRSRCSKHIELKEIINETATQQ